MCECVCVFARCTKLYNIVKSFCLIWLEFIQKSGKYLEMEFSKIQIDLVAVVIVMVLGYHYPPPTTTVTTGIAMNGNVFVSVCVQSS